jgi:hypothetical protein
MMKVPRSITFSILILGVTLGIGFQHYYKGNSNDAELIAKAKEFKIELLDAVSKAKRIEVVEHSWWYDFSDEKGEIVENPPFVEYKRIELTPELKASFRTAIERMSESPKTVFSLCAFNPHHSIEFINQDGRRSVIQVCFECSDTVWDDKSLVPPNEFQKVFRNFIEPLGFQAFRYWGEIAKNQVSDVSARWMEGKSLNDFQLLRSRLSQTATVDDVEALFGEPHGHTQDDGKEFFEYITYEDGQETSCWTAVFDEEGMLIKWHKDR